MKALVLDEPGHARITQIAEPKDDSRTILLRVRMVGLCGSDLNTYRGRNPLVRYPRVPGHEIAATVARSSPDHPQWREGMNVTLSPYTSCGRCASCRRNRPNACQFNETLGVQRDGALTEYIAVEPGKLYAAASLSIKELCLVEPLTVGFHAVARGRVTASDTVAVFGCGGVGLGAIAACRFAGANTIAIDLEDGKLALATKAGATTVINSKTTSIREALRELTDGRGPDVIVEAVGRPDTFRAAVEEVAFTGRVVYIGYAKEPVAYETKLFVQKELDILGSRNALPEDFRSVIRMLEGKTFPVNDTVSTVVGIDEAPAIFAEWNDNPAKFSKIMVQID